MAKDFLDNHCHSLMAMGLVLMIEWGIVDDIPDGVDRLVLLLLVDDDNGGGSGCC